ncbi:M23 family peptidase, partial [Burkholderia pseudomallei]
MTVAPRRVERPGTAGPPRRGFRRSRRPPFPFEPPFSRMWTPLAKPIAYPVSVSSARRAEPAPAAEAPARGGAPRSFTRRLP